jgi:peptide deformylase
MLVCAVHTAMNEILPILTIGDPRLELRADPMTAEDVATGSQFRAELERMHATLGDFRQRHGFGRAMAAPQVGVGKRAIVMNLGATEFALLNPEIVWRSKEMFEVWDDCLSVPDRIVRVERHVSVSIRYRDEQWRERVWHRLPADLAELVQHEIDHLDGILMTERAHGADAVRPIAEHAALIGQARPRRRLSLDRIARAAREIDPVFRGSPQYSCDALNAEAGCRITLKVETANPIRSFKGRGADFLLREVQRRGDDRQIVCASAGNWGQALAYAGRAMGRRIVVFAAATANPMKLEAMRRFGAEVRIAGEDFDAAKLHAKAFAEEMGAWMVEDGREPEITEGAGSIALELLQQGDAYDHVVAPLGNGALLNGIARWFKAASPATLVAGVCAAGADSMQQSFATGQVVNRQSVQTIADGIGVRAPVAEAVSDMNGLVDDVHLVTDDQILHAMRRLYLHTGLLIEPAGAAGLAAVLAKPEAFAGQHVAVVLCGSNMTQAQIREWILQA